MRLRYATVAVTLLAAVLVPSSAVAAGSPAGPIATYNGAQIDLSQGWGTAQACLVADGEVECFANRSGLLARENQLATQTSAPGGAFAGTVTTTCSSPLRLYADAGYGGRELDFYDRGTGRT